MNIHLFGHSICRSMKTDSQKTKTFVDILEERYSTENDTLTVCQADTIAEERILYFLKKTKSIDLAIIFHQGSETVFVPASRHDFPIVKADNDIGVYHKCEGPIEYFKNVMEDKSKSEIEIRDGAELQTAYNLYFKWLHTRDMNRNRFYGALLQIDQYVTAKKIPTIHCVYDVFMPSWFTFSSGIVDDKLTKLQDKGPYFCTHNESVNRINSEGNLYIADKIAEYITQLNLVPRVGIEPTTPDSSDRCSTN